MWFLKSYLIIIVINVLQVTSLEADYYWREYTGEVPQDAIIGREEDNGTKIYIGQAYVKNAGLIVVEIIPGIKEVYAPIFGSQRITNYIKILCGNQENFQWHLTNADDIQVFLIGKTPILGGHYNGDREANKIGNFMNIGRIKNSEGHLRIGRITWFVVTEPPSMFYYNNGNEISFQKYYQVLLYTNRTNEYISKHYYWREYTGAIPIDAIAGGKDINGRPIYIGQKYVKQKGLIVVPIYPDQQRMLKSKDFVKVLCGLQFNFFWIPATAKNYHQVMIDKFPVTGGHQDGSGYLAIGRISCDGETQIGKINAHKVGDAKFIFIDQGVEREFNSYEVLVYSEPEIDPRIFS